jgi:hypothetical protein
MKDADGTIERLLAGLRDAEPPGGMERRILEALDGMEVRQGVASASLWRLPFRPAIAMLLACTVTLMAIFTVEQRKHVPGQPHGTPGQALVPVKPHGTLHGRLGQAGQATEGLNGAPNIFSSLRVGQKPQRSNGAALRQLPPVKHPQNAPAAGETQTASFPAPPLPLTEQERLLLRLAHRGDADNMAILNPVTRAAQTAKATEQFQQFFAINATEMRSQSE